MTPLLSMLAGAKAFGLTAFRNLFEPQGAYDALATITVPSGGTTSVSFSGIPQGYKHLQIRASVRNTSGTYNDIRIGFNGDSGTSYSWHRIISTGSGAPTAGGGASTTLSTVGLYTGPSAGDSNAFAANIIDIFDYNSSIKNKTIKSLVGSDGNNGGYIIFYSGAWYNLNPVNSINFTPLSGSFAQHSTFALYGVK